MKSSLSGLALLKALSNRYQLFFLAIICLCMSTLNVAAQVTRYVKPVAEGTGTGLSWENASSYLQAMITASSAGDLVFVAKGEYQPVLNTSFIMKEGVKIYGGFQGTEMLLSQRVIGNTSSDSSILKGNGRTVINNTFTVTTAITSASVLDGFTITGGSSTINNTGGGITNNNASPTLTNLIVSNNNRCGIFNINNSSSIITNSIVRNNTSVTHGAGIYNSNRSNVTLTNVTIANNNITVSNFHGGGLYINGTSILTLNNVIITNNSVPVGSSQGGGVFMQRSNCIFNNVEITNNTAASNGGGVYCTNSVPVFTDVTISGNTTTINFSGGGGIYITADNLMSPEFNRVLIS